jgi:hypothetical protein
LKKNRARRLVALTIILAGMGAGVVWMVRELARSRSVEERARELAASVPGDDVRAPGGVRIRVEVLNATRTRGLARRATRWLRDGGFDVVAMGNHREMLDSTVVIDLTNHPDWAEAVAARMGGARVESRPDSSRYLDVSVLVGRSFRPPPQTLYP